MGRAPCCDKTNVKKGPWSPEEDTKLKTYIQKHGTGSNWIALPQKIGLKRCGKSCRLRWLNYLRPNIKHGGFSEEENNVICTLYLSIGSRWSIIAAQLPGRTDNDIKNYWNTRLRKKLVGKQRKDQQSQACRVSNLKQEIKSEPEYFAGVITQTSYWPSEHNSNMHMQVTNNHYVSSQHYDLNNQTSFGNLLLNNNTATATDTFNSQVACDVSLQQEQVYPITMNMINPINSGSDTCLPSNIFPRFENLPNELSDLICVNQLLQVDGSMQGFHGIGSLDMTNNNGSTNTTSTESTSWGDINSLVYSPNLASDYEGYPQGIPQDITFEESRYFGFPMQ
ncbi:hypothetical protein Lal_00007239 [Lupinus albus]|uniref:Putative transcription factor MYB-HB-like family n=1 Tax=Lupinus albus TaxID=3870 RepID=A0A6A4P282_LUPAL|nr:putative transcription factor MYB-HB-like family [Lupinus albus]KAF1874625.1 hypothetical protein Lal_00007239 [Lupinus albus]